MVEPGGAVALAVLLAGRIATRGYTIVVTVSGTNVDPQRLRALIDGDETT